MNHDMTPFAKVKRNVEVDFLPSRSNARFVFVKTSRIGLEPSKNKHNLEVPLKYR